MLMLGLGMFVEGLVAVMGVLRSLWRGWTGLVVRASYTGR